MFTPLYELPLEAEGRLAVAPRPRGGDWLPDEVSRWRSQGATCVVSALTDGEIAELGLEAEESLCEDSGLAFRSFPIVDRSVPDDPTDFASLVSDIETAVRGGGFVVVHCRMGIGRSGTIAAAVLMLFGRSLTEAFEVISRARGMRAPDTPEQVEWLASHQVSGDSR